MNDLRTKDALTLGREIEAGRLDPRELAEVFLDAAKAEDAEHTVYVRLLEDRARAEAEAAADRARLGIRRSPLDGVPVSWKDNYDFAGSPTEAGSALLKGRLPEQDALVVARSARAGLVSLGKTSMTELAYSGLGYNPIVGTPHNPFDSNTPRLPGGSSAGAAVSVARGLAPAGVGSDTGGSVRIPAAWNGLVGLKTTAGRLPLDGIVPLSPTFDTIGPLTRTVADAAALFSVLGSDTGVDLKGSEQDRFSFLVLEGPYPVPVAPVVSEAFHRGLTQIEGGAVTLTRRHVPCLEPLLDLGVSDIATEIHSVWGEAIERDPDTAFIRIVERVRAGADQTASDVETVRHKLDEIRRAYLRKTAPFDAVLLPTVADIAPPIAQVAGDAQAYHQANGRALALTSLANRLGLCAITLPLAPSGSPPLPTGLMAMAPPFAERKLLRIAAALEAKLKLE